MAFFDSTPEFTAFIEAVEDGSHDRTGIWSLYQRHYLKPWRSEIAAMAGLYHRTTVDGIKPHVQDMDPASYRAKMDLLAAQPLRATVEAALGEIRPPLPGPGRRFSGVYMLWGFFLIDGGILLLSGDRAGILLGAEVVAGRDDIASLVQHEYVHICRTILCDTYGDVRGQPAHRALSAVSWAEAAVSEGLATLAPLYVTGEAVTESRLRELMFWTTEQMNAALSMERELTGLVLSRLGEPAYEGNGFRGGPRPFCDDGMPTRFGYFVGARMVAGLVGIHGWDVYPQLVTLPARQVLSMWRSETGE